MTKRRTAKAVRRTAALSAVALLAGLPALTSRVSALDNVTLERVGGVDRYETSQLIANATFPNQSVSDILLASGQNFPDALAGSALAGVVGGPVLLTSPTELSAKAAEAITSLMRVNPKDTTVHILGDANAVSDAVADAVAALGVNVVRIAGPNRYDTAAAIALAVNAQVTIPGFPQPDAAKTVFVATGTKFPDALAAGPLAYDGKHPLLLVNDTVPISVRDALLEMNVNHIVILGDENSVSQAVEDELASIIALNPPSGVTPPVERVAGENRYATASKLADLALSDAFDFDGAEVLLASGTTFADALSGGPHGGVVQAPILLTPDTSLAPATTAWLTDHSDTIGTIRVLGSNARITDAVANNARFAARSIAANQGWTWAPELRNANVMAGFPDVVEYHFDEDVTGQPVNALGLRLYDACGFYALPEAVSIFGSMVRAQYATGAVELSTMTAAQYDTVEDTTGVPNIEGSYPLSDQTFVSAGFDPELTLVDNYTLQGDLNVNGLQEISVDYTFSGPVPLAAAADYNLVFFQGDNTNATGGISLTVLAPNKVRVVFEDTGVINLPETQLRRGSVTFASPSTGEPIVLSERYFQSDGNTVDPDLKIARRINATQVEFVFDEPVGDDPSATLLAPLFHVFTRSGDVLTPDTVVRSATAAEGARVVTATFLTDLLPPIDDDQCDPTADILTDAFVDPFAAQATDNTNTQNGGFNLQDQVVMERPTDVVTPAGSTALPDLLTVDRNQNPVTEDYSVTFTFDAPVDPTAVVDWDLYDINGTQFRFEGPASDGIIDITGTTVTFTDAGPVFTFSNDQMQAAVVGAVQNLPTVNPLPIPGFPPFFWTDADLTTRSVRINN